ncbi:hypothetical protein [Exiguobacterium sp. SH1S1]|nr:hypothetical protein [Exiguobacterium sp. SH1S1]
MFLRLSLHFFGTRTMRPKSLAYSPEKASNEKMTWQALDRLLE